MKNPWVVIGVITILLFGVAFWFSNTSSNINNEDIEIISHIKGNIDASIKLVEYSDFQCPACGTFQPVVAQVMSEYGDRLSFEYKHFPLSNIHPQALPAAVAAEAAGQQGKFFEFHDLLFINQSEWSSSAVPASLFIKYAEELGLDVEQFKRQMKSSILRDKVKDEFNEGRALNITGTPSFFLNGKKMEFDSYAAFVEQITVAIDPTLVNASTSDAVSPNNNGVKFGL